MQPDRLLKLAGLPSVRDRGQTGRHGVLRRWIGRLVVMLAGLTLSACGYQTEDGPYPSLQPIDSLLAEAEVFSTDPGPAQVQRAAQLQSRIRSLTP